MKFLTKILTLAAGVAFLAIGFSASAATNPIANSKHNMNLVFGSGTIEDNQICLPCHAPHNQPDKTQDALWNHVMPTTNYQLWDASWTLDETSKKCLSCHDGTVAVDSYGTTPSVTNPGGIHTGSKVLGASLGDNQGNGSTAGFVIGGGTGDLTHDHPIGVPYPGMNASTGYTYTRGFNDPTKWASTGYQAWTGTSSPPATQPVTYANGKKVVGGSMSLARKLSTDTYGTIVGCGTCHTPHNNSYNFLHIPNTGSQLCLTCHDK